MVVVSNKLKTSFEHLNTPQGREHLAAWQASQRMAVAALEAHDVAAAAQKARLGHQR